GTAGRVDRLARNRDRRVGMCLHRRCGLDAGALGLGLAGAWPAIEPRPPGVRGRGGALRRLDRGPDPRPPARVGLAARARELRPLEPDRAGAGRPVRPLAPRQIALGAGPRADPSRAPRRLELSVVRYRPGVFLLLAVVLDGAAAGSAVSGVRS